MWGLRGHPRGLVLVTHTELEKFRHLNNKLTLSTQAWLSKKEPLGPVPASPPGISWQELGESFCFFSFAPNPMVTIVRAKDLTKLTGTKQETTIKKFKTLRF